MINTKEATDKIHNALYAEEIKSAIIEAFTAVDKAVITVDEKFTSKAAEQNAALEKAQQIIDKKISQLRISITVLFIFLILNLCNQAIAWKRTNVQIYEHRQILEENNELIIEYLEELKKKEVVRGAEKDLSGTGSNKKRTPSHSG